MKTIKGVIKYCHKRDWKDYKYEVGLNEGGDGEVIKITTVRGASVPDAVDIKTLEELALGNASLLDWCEREGWVISCPGTSEGSITRRKNKCLQRIYKGIGLMTGAPQMMTELRNRATHRRVETVAGAPQTMTEPVRICWFDGNSCMIGETLAFQGGITEWLSLGGDKNIPQLEAGKIYITSKNEEFCRHCAPPSVLYSGRDDDGQELKSKRSSTHQCDEKDLS